MNARLVPPRAVPLTLMWIALAGPGCSPEEPAVCGDGWIDPPAETCDGADLGGASCMMFGLADGMLGCHPSCTGFDTSRCNALPSDAGTGGLGTLDASESPGPPDAAAAPGGPGTPGPGDLVVTELMRDPTLVPDSDGEWLEIHNVTDAALELEGITIHDDGSDSFVIGTSIVIAARGFLVLGRSSSPAENGGVGVGYAYGGSFTLSNGEDEIVIRNGPTLIDRMAYTELVLATTPGVAVGLSAAATTAAENDAAGAWCDAIASYNGTDLGSPGLPNEPCP